MRKCFRQITVVKEFSFDAAHHLPEYNGPCSRIHGHHYILQIGVRGVIEFQSGMVLDFSTLKEYVEQEIIDLLDHQYLNVKMLDAGFPWDMPTAENLVVWITRRLQDSWGKIGKDREIAFVRLYETPSSYAEWVLKE